MSHCEASHNLCWNSSLPSRSTESFIAVLAISSRSFWNLSFDAYLLSD
jgi:hypothetical protein